MTAKWLEDVLAYLQGEGTEREFERAAEGFTREIMRRSGQPFSYGMAAKIAATLLALKAKEPEVWNVFLREHVTYKDMTRFQEFRKLAPVASLGTERFDNLVQRSRQPSIGLRVRA